MSNLIGYARVSTKEQDLQLQLDALEKAGKNAFFIVLKIKDFTPQSIFAPGFEWSLKRLFLNCILIKSEIFPVYA